MKKFSSGGKKGAVMSVSKSSPKSSVRRYHVIKAVWVHENGEITVDFNFADEYQRIIDYIENNHNIITVIESKAI